MRDVANYSGWDFANVWAQDPESKSYPYLGMVRAPQPTITRHPVGGWIDRGGVYTLSVTATAPTGGTLSYQWYANAAGQNSYGTKIQGATNAAYIPPTDRDTLVYYYAVVTNTTLIEPDESKSGSNVASMASEVAKIRVGNYPDAILSQEQIVPELSAGNESAAVSPPPPKQPDSEIAARGKLLPSRKTRREREPVNL